MSTHNDHTKIMEDYISICRFGKKVDTLGMLMQASIVIVLFSWRPAEVGYYKIAMPVLFSLSLYFFSKDFVAFLKIDTIKTKLIMKGIGIEKKNSRVKSFFQECLNDFNLLKILILRFSANLVFVSIIGHLFYQYLVEINPAILISRQFLAFIFPVGLSILVCMLYYPSFKPLEKLQKSAAQYRGNVQSRILTTWATGAISTA